MQSKNNCTILSVFALLASLIFSSACHAQDAEWTKQKPARQLEFDLVNLGINYQQQLGKRFAMRIHASSGIRYFWGMENATPKKSTFFIPYLMAEIRWYPGHKRNKNLKWKYSPLDGFYAQFVSSVSFLAPEKIILYSTDYWGFPYPVTTVGLGYQHRFFKYGFVNLSAAYGLVHLRYYRLGRRSFEEITHGPFVNFGLGFTLPLKGKK